MPPVVNIYADFQKCFNLPPDLQDSAHANFVAWERLRLYYNGALVVLTAGTGLGAALLGTVLGQQDEGFARLLFLGMFGLFGAIPINIAYCVGPVAEGYLVRSGINRGTARRFLFFAGLAMGGGMAVLTALGFVWSPDGNFD